MSKRLYLRIIEDIPTDISPHLKLKLVRQNIENLIQIEWKLLPKIDDRGGFIMVGMIPDDTNLDAFVKNLKNAGYLAVI